ncbi:LysR family transcriptional regulator [Paracoccus aminophilus]|uniref:Transcriptional regulator, LysR family n=1 Tax=Paracoccus aminophilus JCM 7686 TaxID=1367847 RepID=S5XZI2_PARAH|nr:LysR family transcriptional regulator [Paracoccus aminophilus]AGT08855.1 transcriptional regulator, LysR family [Paracoccus aminophilus JCM 7686]
MTPSLRQIHAAVALARTLSFTRAADELNISQPALTVQIRNLEEMLGQRIYDRDNRSVQLTGFGRAILPSLQRLMREMDATLSDIQEIREGGGVTRIASLPSFATGVLPRLILDFRSLQPQAHIHVSDVVASRVFELVQRGECDLGVSGGPHLPGDLEVLQSGVQQLHVVFPLGHPYAAREALSLSELIEQPLVMMDASTSVRTTLDAAAAKLGVKPRISVEVAFMATAVAMVRAGLGVAILPGAAREVVIDPEVDSRPIADAELSRQILFVCRRGFTLSPTTERFAAMVGAAIAGI